MKKHRFKKIVVFLQIFVFSFEISFGSSAIWTKGSGTETDPYLIESSDNLEYLAEMLHFGGVSGYKGVYFKLTTNIAYKGERIEEEFAGYFDGGNFTITQTVQYHQSTTSAKNRYSVLFLNLKDATISNLVVENFGVAHDVFGGTTITNCSMIGKTTKGLITRIYGNNTTISYCSNYATITAIDSDVEIGGICSYIDGSNNKIIACYNVGSITGGRGTEYVGGILGVSEEDGKCSILNCYNTGMLKSQYTGGGIVHGIGNAKVVKGCYTTGGYYIKGSGVDNYKIGIDVSSSIAKTQDFVDRLNFDGEVFIMDFTPNTNSGYPIIAKNVDIKVTSSNTSMGSVSGGGNIKQGQVITISATPKTGYHFVQWNDGNTNASRSITVTAAATYTATFAINTYALTVTSNNTTMGTVTGGGTYDYNKSVTITATPNEHYHFVRWNDGNTNASRSVTITANATYTATFAIDTHVLTVTSDDTTMGAVIGGGTYDYNESVTITATPETGYHFVEWTDGNANASRSVTVTADATYTATFAINTYTLQVFSADEELGTVIGGGTFDYNKEQTIVATATKDHYHFWKWNDGITTNPRTILVTEDGSYTANFVLDTFALATTVNDTIMGMTSGDGNYAYNSSATATATANYGYVFKKWNDGNTDNPRVVTITNNINLVANFVLDTFNISASSNDVSKGIVTGAGKYPYNSEATLSANATEHYHFVKWNDGNIANPRTVIVTKDASYSAVFAIDTFAISVVVNDVEMGTVTGAGKYIYGSEQDLEATANYGYVFKNWKDGETAAQRTITVTKNATYTAVFEKEVFSVSITSTDESKGTVSAGGEIAYLSEIQLIATPKEHYHFVKWNDGNIANPRTVIVTKDASYSAVFAIDTFAISVVANDVEMGTVTGDGNYAYNSSATATATANYGYVFKKWNDGNTDNPRIVTITNNTNLVANFVPDTFNISISSNDVAKGTVTGAGKYPYNSEATLSANATEHYHFLKWSDGNTTNPRTEIVTKDASYTAVFAIDTFAISVVANDADMGTVSGSGNYIYGSEQDLEATANYGYVFKNWKDGETVAQRTITVTKNATYTAVFEKEVFSVSIASTDESKGTVSAGGEIAYLSEIQLVATPKEHYHFVKWSDGDLNATRTITVTKDLNLTAEFAIDEFTLTVVESENGTVTGEGNYAYNTLVTLTATPNEHYHFVQWSDAEKTNPRQVVVINNATYKAEFAIDEFTVSLSADAEMGIVQGNDTYAYGQTITILATPNYGYKFKHWNDGNTSASREIVVLDNVELEAQFEKATFSVNIASNDETKGTISINGKNEYLSEIQLVANPKEHYHFVKWSDGNTNASRSIIVTENVNLTAEFAIDVFELSIENCENGVISGAGKYAYNTDVTLTAIPDEYYHFAKWNDGATTNPRKVVVTNNATYKAEFAIDEFTVSLSTDAEMGTVQGNGSYEYGQNITISATPNYGYEFKQWSDGNTSALREIVVLDNIDMEAQFEKTTFSVNIISNDETKGSVTAGGEIVYNSELQLEATAKEHCHFVKWSDGNTDNPRVIIVTEAMNLTAEFAIDTFIVTLSVNKEDMGSVQGAGEYVYGQISTISAKPNEHFSFVKWSDENTEDIREITITENVAYKAIFEKQTYIVDVVSSDDDMGSVKIIGNSFYYGDEIVLSAKANNGYYFVKWSDGDENATRTYKIGGNKILIAYFEGSTAIQEVEQSHEVTISNRQIFVNGEAPAFVITSVGQKIANQNLKAGIYFVQVGNEMQGVAVKSR